MGNVHSQGPDEGLGPLILESKKGMTNAGQLPNLRKRAVSGRLVEADIEGDGMEESGRG
jgi:hypothetical protein